MNFTYWHIISTEAGLKFVDLFFGAPKKLSNRTLHVYNNAAAYWSSIVMTENPFWTQEHMTKLKSTVQCITYSHFFFWICSKVISPLFWLQMNQFKCPLKFWTLFWCRGQPTCKREEDKNQTIIINKMIRMFWPIPGCPVWYLTTFQLAVQMYMYI